MADDARILELILARCGERNGRKTLPCPDAFALAEDNDLELMDIAKVCNRHKVKIVKCQLGCFP